MRNYWSSGALPLPPDCGALLLESWGKIVTFCPYKDQGGSPKSNTCICKQYFRDIYLNNFLNLCGVSMRISVKC